MTRLLRVRPSTPEQRLHAELRRYATRIWEEPSVDVGARLATVVLTKRALSSAAAVFHSLERRLSLLASLDDEPSPPAAEQLALPLDAPGAPDCPADELSDAALEAPGLSDRRLERRWLATLCTLALGARQAESKRDALVRFVGRTRESVVVFTEYRDTLAMLVRALAPVAPVAALHGAQATDERRDALARFGDGRARILVATDAACEGLNLHARCRLVLVYELPWNPNRLEQRIGRVDRLGQTKRVHVVELVLAESREDVVLARLTARRSRIAAALDPGRGTGEATDTRAFEAAAFEAAMVLEGTRAPAHAERRPPAQARHPPSGLLRLNLDEDSRRACAALEQLRRLIGPWTSLPAPRDRGQGDETSRRTNERQELSRVAAQLRRRAPWVAVLDSRRRMTSRRATRAWWHRAASGDATALALLLVTEIEDSSGRHVAAIPTVLVGPCPPGSHSRAREGLPSARRSRAPLARFVEQLLASPQLLTEAARAGEIAAQTARLADARLIAHLQGRDAEIQRERHRRATHTLPDLFGRLPTGLSTTLRARPRRQVAIRRHRGSGARAPCRTTRRLARGRRFSRKRRRSRSARRRTRTPQRPDLLKPPT